MGKKTEIIPILSIFGKYQTSELRLKKEDIDSIHRREFNRIWFKGYSAFWSLISWNVMLANAVLSHLELFIVWLARVSLCCALLVSLNREHKTWIDWLECSSCCLISRRGLWSYLWSFMRNQFHWGDCYPSLSILSRIVDLSSSMFSSGCCKNLSIMHLFIITEGVTLLVRGFLFLCLKNVELPLRFIVMAP